MQMIDPRWWWLKLLVQCAKFQLFCLWMLVGCTMGFRASNEMLAEAIESTDGRP